MKDLLLVGAGSFCGGCLRYLCALWIEARLESPFPWGIFLVNVTGCAAIGLLSPLYTRLHWMSDSAIPLLVSVGLLGGFTTFSSFSLQSLRLMQAGHWTAASLYVGGSVLSCLLGVYLGYRLGFLLFAR